MIRSFSRIFLIAILLAGLGVASLWALPPAGAYPSRDLALKAPGELEQEIFQRLADERRRRRTDPLEYDAVISAVAREHAEAMMQEQTINEYIPRLGTMDYRLHRAGVSAVNTRYAFFQANTHTGLMSQIDAARLHVDSGATAGVGVASRGRVQKEFYAAVILREKRCTIEPFPTMPLHGRTYRLRGRLVAGYAKPTLVVTFPDGRTGERDLEMNADSSFETLVRFDSGKGRYIVEVLAEGRLGPAVVELMHCFAGVPYPDPAPPEAAVETPADLRQAERITFDLINRSRREAGLKPLAYDERLAAVARDHSDDMRRNRFFAHTSPTQGDLAARMERAGIKARRFTENLAGNADLGAAHRGLMGSPGHRKNILDPDVDRVGVGVVMAEEKHLLITQNFAQDFREIDSATESAGLLRAINAARAKSNDAALKNNDTLARIASLNAGEMARQGRISHDKARAELERARLPYRFVQMAVFRSTEPPTPEQIAEALKARYHEIGIGMAQSDTDGEKPIWTTVLLGER